jgi:hypothetical protein
LVNYLMPLDQKNGWSTDGAVDHWTVVYRNMVSASQLVVTVERSYA